MSRRCSRCFIDKDLSEFILDKRRNNYWTYCKQCYNKQRKQYRFKNPSKLSAIDRKARYKFKYGLDVKDVKRFGECPICKKDKRLVVDHCHTKGRGTYRGFICYNCNTLLGHIENKEKMKAVYEYLNVPEIS